MEKAAISLAVAAVSPIISMLSKKADPYFGGDITDEDLRHLQINILPKIQTAIDVADEIKSDKLKPWVMNLMAAVLEYEYESIKSKVSPLPTSLKKFKGKAKELLAPVSFKTSLKKSVDKLQQSADEAEKLISFLDKISKPTPQSDTAKQQQHGVAVSGRSSPVVGREEERDSLIRLLIDESHKSSSSKMSVPCVLALRGIGGAGKTTLAQYVYADPKVKTHFTLRMWVHVSSKFDVHRVTKKITESAVAVDGGCSSVDKFDVDNLDVLQTKLKKILISKKFLLVLDDVWCEDSEAWDKLLIPLRQGGKEGSKILITTRMEGEGSRLGVDNSIPLKELKTEDCWSIMKHYALGDANKAIEDEGLESVGKQIAYKLKNSPLAARVVGSSLQQKMDIVKLRTVLRDDLLKDTMDALFLSFQHLPQHLQRCFAFCSLYPKGFLFKNLKELVGLWIANGYVVKRRRSDLTLEEIGMENYFKELVYYSFFQPHRSQQGVYVIHDLLHDLAAEISKDHCVRIEGDMPVSIPDPTSVIHLSISTDNLAVHLPCILKLVNLRTFIIFSSSKHELSNIDEYMKGIFKKLTKLRVLHLGDNLVKEFNDSIDRLKHLRYLRLWLSCEVKRLPESLCRLYHIRFMIIRGNASIDRMPKGLNNLLNLRHLLVPPTLDRRITEVGRLTCLQTLEYYSAKHGIEQLENLRELRGKLRIDDLESVRNEADARGANLKNKQHLEELTLSWNVIGRPEGEDQDEAVIEGLEPPRYLKHLCIKGYGGRKLPCWMQRYGNLQCLELSNCPNLRETTDIPRHLKVLKVEDCQGMRTVGSLPHGLRELSVKSCPGLWICLPNNGCRLQMLTVRGCRAVVNLSKQAPSIKDLVIEDIKFFWYFNDIFELEWHSLVHLKLKLNGMHAIQPFLLRFSGLTALEALEIGGSGIMLSDGIGFLPHLQTLAIDDCPNVDSVGNLQPLTSLKELKVTGCPLLKTGGRGGRGGGRGGGGAGSSHLPSIKIKIKVIVDEILLLPVLLGEQGLNSVEELQIWGCSQDAAFSDEQHRIFQFLTSLVSLSFLFCCHLPSLPDLPTSLQLLTIHDCEKLRRTYGKGGILHDEIQRIPALVFVDGSCVSLDRTQEEAHRVYWTHIEEAAGLAQQDSQASTSTDEGASTSMASTTGASTSKG